MKFRMALVLSMVLHASLFLMVMIVPEMDTTNGTTYYVDLIQLSGNGSPGSGSPPPASSGKTDSPNTAPQTADASLVEEKVGTMKDLAVKKAPETKMRYPDKKSRNRWQPPPKPLVTVTRKKRGERRQSAQVSRKPAGSGAGGVLSTGLSGTGGGGGGTGSGTFPYSYYVQALRDRISGSWYRSLVSPGLRGKHVSTVYFRIGRRGRIQGLKVEKSSGVDALDLSARRAVENASPFPPLPDDFPYSYLVVHFEFEWVKK